MNWAPIRRSSRRSVIKHGDARGHAEAYSKNIYGPQAQQNSSSRWMSTSGLRLQIECHRPCFATYLESLSMIVYDPDRLHHLPQRNFCAPQHIPHKLLGCFPAGISPFGRSRTGTT